MSQKLHLFHDLKEKPYPRFGFNRENILLKNRIKTLSS